MIKQYINKEAKAYPNLLDETSTSPNKPYLTKGELANRLNKSTRTIEIWGQRGIIPYIKIQRSVLYDWKDVVSALSHFSSKGGLR